MDIDNILKRHGIGLKSTTTTGGTNFIDAHSSFIFPTVALVLPIQNSLIVKV